ncbi:phosphoribosyltransferase [Sphingomonas sp. LaA6.9]|uniref:phosphoribosyltransferase n=1 Tax=Sphingomonas sp. LaA6.9 TaxID=2919914 RepID=UPI001F4F7AD0|nr:phosphoribosyltransferase family protein [Sphingomonas sp. LaA6.9]MCJ8155955.1 phosphoribosyltransferase domain-containing protein [Sphingomonas sp. LaA6.9]
MTDPVLTPVGYDTFVADIHTLATALADSEWQPGFIIGIGRGGLVPATYLSHACGLPLLSVDHSTGIESFGDRLLGKLAGQTRDGAHLLVVDDINDSGRTIGHIRRALRAAGSVADNIRYAVLIDNVTSTERVDYYARSIDRTVTKDWFVFPWEAVADRTSILRDAAEVPERIA